MKYLYLDTSRIRLLAENRNASHWQDIDNVLRENDDCALVLSYFHLLEFSRWSGDDDICCDYLNSLRSVKWAMDIYDVWREEVANALEGILTGEDTRAPIVFRDSFIDTLRAEARRNVQYGLTPLTVSRVVEVFRTIDATAPLDQKIVEEIEMVYALRENAAIWRDWRNVLRGHIRAYWPERTQFGFQLQPTEEYINVMLENAEDLLPGLTFMTKLQKVKFSETRSVDPNDIYDEYHSSYAPFCVAIMHDRDACGRVSETGADHARRFASEPEGFLRLFSSTKNENMIL